MNVLQQFLKAVFADFPKLLLKGTARGAVVCSLAAAGLAALAAVLHCLLH